MLVDKNVNATDKTANDKIRVNREGADCEDIDSVDVDCLDKVNCLKAGILILSRYRNDHLNWGVPVRGVSWGICAHLT